MFPGRLRESVAVSVRQVDYVNITRSSENLTWHTSRIPGLFADPLPMVGTVHVAPGITTTLWVTLTVRSNATAGIHDHRVLVMEDGVELGRISLSLRVWAYSVESRSLATDSGLCGFAASRWHEWAHAFPGMPRDVVTAGYFDQMTSHRVNYMIFDQVYPQIEVKISNNLLSVELETDKFDRMARRLVGNGLQQIAFPRPSTEKMKAQ